jgi:iron-sulfur cluster assembly protein
MIDITPEAIKHLAEAAKKSIHHTNVRLGVRGSGCSGLAYVIELESVHKRETKDISWTVDDVTFVVDPKSILILSGSTLTWAHRGLMSGLEFVNPNEASRCGCGVSFTLKRDS